MIGRTIAALALFSLTFLAGPAGAETCLAMPCIPPEQLIVERTPVSTVEQGVLNNSTDASVAPLLAVPLGLLVLGLTLSVIAAQRLAAVSHLRSVPIVSGETVQKRPFPADQRVLARQGASD